MLEAIENSREGGSLRSSSSTVKEPSSSEGYRGCHMTVIGGDRRGHDQPKVARLHSESKRAGGRLLLTNTRRQEPMTVTEESEVREANEQFIGAATQLCANFPGAELVHMPGLIAAWRNTPIPISNSIFLSKPVTDEHDLEQRIGYLADYISRKVKPPEFLVCQEWIPESLREAADAQIVEAGLAASATITGMAADGLLPATRRFDVPLEWRRVADETTRRDFADTNSAAYGFPVECEREALGTPQMWSDDRLAGYVAYLDDWKPVAAAAAMPLNGKIHVLCVATRPKHQRQGLADRTIRYALDQMGDRTGLTRTTLSATEAGLPAYARMGYHETATFIVYTRDGRSGESEPRINSQ